MSTLIGLGSGSTSGAAGLGSTSAGGIIHLAPSSAGGTAGALEGSFLLIEITANNG